MFIYSLKAMICKEPVLLIGETGTGKTSIAKIIANIFNVPFYSLNCHKNTEA